MESDGPLGWSDDGEEYNGVDDVDTTDLSQPDPAHDGANEPEPPPGDDADDPEEPEESDAAGSANESLEFDDLAADSPGDEDSPGTDAGDDHTNDGDPADAPDNSNDPDASTDPVPGSDPDADPVADDPSWTSQDPFPPALNLDQPPEPVDGFPWSDPQSLGDEPVGDPADDPQQPPAEDLFAYDGQQVPDNGDAWDALQRSEDPATSSLARFWSGTS